MEVDALPADEDDVGGGEGAGRSGWPGIWAAGRLLQRGETPVAASCLQSRSTESKRLKLPVELSRKSEPERI